MTPRQRKKAEDAYARASRIVAETEDAMYSATAALLRAKADYTDALSALEKSRRSIQ